MIFCDKAQKNLHFTFVKENELLKNPHEYILKDEIVEQKDEISKIKYISKRRRISESNRILFRIDFVIS